MNPFEEIMDTINDLILREDYVTLFLCGNEIANISISHGENIPEARRLKDICNALFDCEKVMARLIGARQCRNC